MNGYVDINTLPPYISAHTFTVKTFGDLKYASEGIFKTYTRDRVLSILETHNVDIALSGFRDALNISKPSFAYFATSRSRTTSDLYLFVSNEDPILNEIADAIALDKKDAAALRKKLPPKCKVESMDDIIGTPLFVNDWIAYCKCNTMYIGQIEKFTEKTITVHDIQGLKTSSIFSGASSKLSPEQMLIYRLSH